MIPAYWLGLLAGLLVTIAAVHMPTFAYCVFGASVISGGLLIVKAFER